MTPPLARIGEQCLDFSMRNSKPIHKIELKGKNKKKKKKKEKKIVQLPHYGSEGETSFHSSVLMFRTK